MSNRTEIRKYWASLLMLVILLGIIGYLTYIPVPSQNKEIIVTVLGVVLGGGAAAMPNLFGSTDADTEILKEKFADLKAEHEILKASYTTLKENYDSIMKMLIERHVVNAEGIVT
jgi:hypothetical protein